MTTETDKTVKRAAELWAAELLRGDKERFQLALEAEIKIAISDPARARSLPPDFKLDIRTDYDPDDTLWNALEAAGVEMPKIACNSCRETLPYKSVMTISPGVIKVKWGYGAPWEHILIEPATAR